MTIVAGFFGGASKRNFPNGGHLTFRIGAAGWRITAIGPGADSFNGMLKSVGIVDEDFPVSIHKEG